jgi:uncharacterized protein YecE (DUF72 family)
VPSTKTITSQGAGRLSIGTSGWSYESWRESFYPSTCPKKDWLKFYSSRFATSEINSSFYRTPTLEAVAAWRDQTPAAFTFSWKASKFITHWKRLTASCENSIALMHTRPEVLRPRLAVVLFQLPPHFAKNVAPLDAFMGMLPPQYRYAFEFRNRSWYSDEVFAALTARQVALCISDHADAPTPWRATAPHIYIRGHGPSGNYRDHYPIRVLRRWAQAIIRWQGEGRDVFVYFDNDQKAAAPADAMCLIEAIRAEAPRDPRQDRVTRSPRRRAGAMSVAK